MHHSSGLALVLLGLLVLADRLTRARFTAIRVAIGLLWVVFGTHLFIRSDPEGWPVGPASLLESFSMPTWVEWVQHKLLSLIPIALGMWTFISRRVGPTAPQSYAVAAMAGLGAAGLLFHHHLDHPVLDLVNLQHRFLAVTSLFIAGSMALDGRTEETNRYEPFLLPTGLVMMGIQLILYVE